MRRNAQVRRKTRPGFGHVGRAGVVTGLAVGTALGAYALTGGGSAVLQAETASAARPVEGAVSVPWELNLQSLLERPVVHLRDLPPAPAFQQLAASINPVAEQAADQWARFTERRRTEVEAFMAQAAAQQAAAAEAARVAAAEAARVAAEQATAAEAARAAGEQATAAEAARAAGEQAAAEAARVAAAQAAPAAQDTVVADRYVAQPAPQPEPEVAPAAAPEPAAPVFAPVSIAVSGAEARVVQQLNAVRASVGLPAFGVESGLTAAAQAQVARIAASGSLFHQDLHPLLAQWNTAGENVGYGPDIEVVHSALVASPGHSANMVNGSFTNVGVAVTTGADGRIYVAQVFGG